MLNWIFIILIAGATIAGAYGGKMQEVTKAGIESAKVAVELAIGLIGQMAVWLGMMRILRDGGLLHAISRKVGRVLSPIFSDIPEGHPAMAAMVMNIAANMCGLANAATPFGLKAMRELDKINPHKGVATNSMALFLAINTSGVAVMPLGIIAVRAMMDVSDPAAIFIPSILATMCSTTIAILIAKTLERRPMFAIERSIGKVEIEERKEDEAITGLDEAEEVAAHQVEVTGWRRYVLPTFVLLIAGALLLQAHNTPSSVSNFAFFREVAAQWILPLLMALIVLYGLSRSVRVYESFVIGAKEGFQIAIMIIPFLVAILVAIGVFRASGMLDVIIAMIRPLSDPVGFPADALPMALIRPLSGSGALTVVMDTLKTHGPDSFVGFVVSVMNGSTETTFYVLALYYGSIQVRAARHTVIACLAADFTGVIMAVVFASIFF